MLKRTLITITIVSLCLLLLLLTTTNPASAGPFGLLVIFVTAYLTCLGLISFFLYGITKIPRLFLAGSSRKKPVREMTLKRSYYYATILAAAPVMFVGLQSVGAIGVYEVLLVAIFEVIGCVYVTKRID